MSYGWRLTSETPIADGATVELPTPGFDRGCTDTRHPQLLVRSQGENQIYKGDDGVGIAFAGEHAAIANNTGKEWEAGAELYLYCPALPSNLYERVESLEQRVLKLEGGGMNHHVDHEDKETKRETLHAKKEPPPQTPPRGSHGRR